MPISIDFDAIRATITDVVTDTFFTTPVVYHKATKSDVDRWGEGDTNTFTDYTMNAMVEYGNNDGDKINIDMQGALSMHGVKVSFNANDFEANGLYVNGVINANAAKDYITVNSKYYKVMSIVPDGPFETQNILIVVFADAQPNAS